MSFTNDVLTGYATLISGAGLGVFKPNGVYAATDLGIFLGTMPDAPDRCIVLNVIPLTAAVTVSLNNVALQVAARGARNNPLDANTILDPIMDLLHGRMYDVFGTTTVNQSLWVSGVPMGQDASVRTERADRYSLDISPATTALRPV